MNFTKTEAKEIRNILNEKLKDLGYSVDVGSITYGEDLKVKLTFAKYNENKHGVYADTKEAKEFKCRSENFGLMPECLNESFIFKNNTYTIKGYNTRAKRYPINLDRNGKSLKCTVDHLKKIIAPTHPEFFI